MYYEAPWKNSQILRRRGKFIPIRFVNVEADRDNEGLPSRELFLDPLPIPFNRNGIHPIFLIELVAAAAQTGDTFRLWADVSRLNDYLSSCQKGGLSVSSTERSPDALSWNGRKRLPQWRVHHPMPSQPAVFCQMCPLYKWIPTSSFLCPACPSPLRLLCHAALKCGRSP